MKSHTMQHINLGLDESGCLDLSVIIPIYNDTVKFENLLISYLKSFAESSLTYEIVVVDNNSPKSDEIKEIIHRYKHVIPLTFVMQPQLRHPFALCSARNRGALNARGEYLFFTDSDCMVDAAFPKAVQQIIASNHPVRVYTGERVFVRVDDRVMDPDRLLMRIPELERTPSPSNYGKVKDRRFPWIERLPQQVHPWNFVHGCFILLKKSDYLTVGGSDTAYDGNWGYEEIDLVFRMVQKLGAEVHYLPDSKVYHQEFEADLMKNETNTARTNKSQNPNYQRICRLIQGFDEFKQMQWDTLNVKTS